MGATLGFTSDIETTTERYLGLETNAIGVDILWRTKTTDSWQQFSVTLPAQSVRGYTTSQIKDDLNTLVLNYLQILLHTLIL